MGILQELNPMGKLFAIFGFSIAFLWCAGCGGRAYTGDQRFPLEGTATFDGAPIDLGSISLVPVGSAASNSESRASGGVINDGKYSVPEEKGPTAGTYRVEIHWLKQTGKKLRDAESGEMYDQRLEALPGKFHQNSELTVEIPSPDNQKNFEMKSG